MNYIGIAMGIGCDFCKGENAPCSECQNKYRCSICHNVVRGLSLFCQSCGHGGHTTHITHWFQSCHSSNLTPPQCPTGCGCNCLEYFDFIE